MSNDQQIEELTHRVRELQGNLNAMMQEFDELQESVDAISMGMAARFVDAMRVLRTIGEHIGISVAEDGASADDDVFYADAKMLVVQAGKASTSFLQRRLGIGYSRAARF